MPSRSFFRRPAVLLVLALCAVAAVVSLLGKIAGGGRSELKAVALVNSSGSETYPSFSPDGKRLAYSARRGKEPFHLFVRRLPSGAPQQLTSAADSDTGPAWSPDGTTMAFLRGEGSDAQCMTIPAGGGAERRIAACAAPAEAEWLPPSLAWMPDGKALIAAVATGEVVRKPEAATDRVQTTRKTQKIEPAGSSRDGEPSESSRDGEPSEAEPGPAFALTVFPLDGGAAKRLTEPPPKGRGDFSPVASPDGSRLAFVRDPRQGSPDIFVVDLPAGGKPLQLTFEGHGIRGLAWTPDGSDLVFSGDRGPGGWRLWRVPASGGSARDLIVAGRRAQYPAVARAGGRLAYTESPNVAAIWRSPLGGDDAPGVPLIRSTGRESSPEYSRDGKRIACISDQSGAEEVWLSDADGGNRTQLTHFSNNARPFRPRWSPDGSKLLFEVRGLGEPLIQVSRSDGGEPQRLVNGGAGSWSHDGSSIYYSYRNQVWKASATGANQRRITNNPGGGMQPEESADGKYVYYRQWRSIWRVRADGDAEEELFQPEHDLIWGGAFQVSPKGLYYVEWNRPKRMTVILFYDLSARKSSEAFAAKDGELSSFSISPDGKYVLYPRVDRSETNLMLVEGFK